MSRLQKKLAGSGTYVIAEAGVNHNGDIHLAEKLVDIAAEAGADAVKFQLFDPEELASPEAPRAEYQERGMGEGSQVEMLQKLTLPLDAYKKLSAHAAKRGIDMIVTPYDSQSARFVADLGVAAIKVPSGEITNIPFLEEVAAFGQFTILSTGMSTLEEVKHAVEPFKKKKVPIALLHCVSSYPAPVDQIHLHAMEVLRKEFDVPVGYSDHTESIEVSLAAVALGAKIIEKHFTLDRSLPGPDHAASLEPAELTAMVRGIQMVEKSLGEAQKKCQPCEENVREVARKSLTLRTSLHKGDEFTKEVIAIRRPGTGLQPTELKNVLGKHAKRDLPSGVVLQKSDIA